MNFWLFILSCATAGFHAIGICIVWLVERTWFIEHIPSLKTRIFLCSLGTSLTVSLGLTYLFVLSTYNIYKGTGSAWDIQFSAWGAKWISPFTSGILIFLLFHQRPLTSRGEVTAILFYILAAYASIYWKTPVFSW